MRRVATERRKLAYRAATDAPHRLLDNFLSHIPVPKGAAVSGFWPMGEEIDVRPLLLHLHAQGHPIGLPATGPRGSLLRFRRWAPETTLIAGVFGTREPPKDAPDIVPDLLIVPLLAFDADGWRLGYGGGYYDRTLAGLRAERTVTAVGVAFAAQQVDAVPHGGSDQRLDWVVTEEAALRVAPEMRKPQS